jgi:hypothetical protein
MRRACFIVAAVLGWAVVAHANSIPTFNLTQGTISVSGDCCQTSLSWSFTGAGGVSLAGNGPGGTTCFNTVVAGGSATPPVAVSIFSSLAALQRLVFPQVYWD